MSGAAFAVLVVVADFAAPDGGGSYPSVATIARLSHFERKRVMRAIAELEAAGLIAVVRRHGAASTYRVNLAALTGPAAGPVPREDQSQEGTGPVPLRDLNQSQEGTLPSPYPPPTLPKLDASPAAPPSPTPKKRREPSELDRRAKALLDHWHAETVRLTGQKPVVQFHPARQAAKAICQAMTDDEARAVVTSAIADPPRYLADHGTSLPLIASAADAIRKQLAGRGHRRGDGPTDADLLAEFGGAP